MADLDVPLGFGGRPLRVLHIGNIANNAYFNAKFLRQAGVEADVLCYDNYWTMSSPEWEEADFDNIPDDHFHPNWWKLNLNGYKRPRWFAQGPLLSCVRYLIAKQQGQIREAEHLWKQLERARRNLCDPTYHPLTERLKPGLRKMIPSGFETESATAETISQSNSRSWSVAAMSSAPNYRAQEFQERCQFLVAEFARRFPERPDKLTLEDLLPFQSQTLVLTELFDYYDIIHAYATDPLYPMLAGFSPYVAFEHGTLRHAPEAQWSYKGPFYDSAIGRITALSYALADHVFITNADCEGSARKLGLQSYEAIPHPLDEVRFAPSAEHRQAIRAALQVQVILFCPIRHDWVDKHVDSYIRALPELRRLIGQPFKACFTPWGKEFERSKALIAELGCEDLVAWVGPFGAISFARWLSAADVVFDQLTYAAFSGITPRALSCGVPVITAYDPAVSDWIFPDPAPVLPAHTTEEVIRHVQQALSPQFQAEYLVRARNWIELYHGSVLVTSRLISAYNRVLNKEIVGIQHE